MLHASIAERLARSLPAWPGVELGEALTGGMRNLVYRARRGRHDLVVRISKRSAEAIEWELDLIQTLSDHGVTVPVAIATKDGRRHVDGLLVAPFLPGCPPSSTRDWSRAAETLLAIHEVTVGWPQRPGFASARDLLVRDSAGDVDMSAMPAQTARLVRQAWKALPEGPTCAVHGDFGAGNILVSDSDVAVIDWDESRVDLPAFDYAALPPNVEAPDHQDRGVIETAGVAWETATCWKAEPVYAQRRLAELEDLSRVKTATSPDTGGDQYR